MWNEILHEHIGVTHVEGHHVVFPIRQDEVSQRAMEQFSREAVRLLKQRRAHEKMLRQHREFADALERNKRAAERLRGTEYEGML
jgi:hypothetical protein